MDWSVNKILENKTIKKLKRKLAGKQRDRDGRIVQPTQADLTLAERFAKQGK